MAIDNTEIKKIALLARLAIDEQELAGYSNDLSNILQMIERINAIDTDGIAPIAHPLKHTIRLRPDCITETNQRELLQKNAPQTEHGYYLVPKVIE